ncbi:MAG: VOC family protein [Smithellaceae bacterium]|jgi:catechol 2,3-dioxygenase-like lactoylglutathione lyase family enzyme|nr:VOC family protein [Syntrophaceae bacterium]HNZ31566.1 VOC family protein [Smithellaceae bacterium]MBP8608967.1 VOC family protein [Syntrophaceae bacterium]HOZ61414.1 VOC family protein [Smithellaceae bacterium]HPG54273.1 VOC family protein [Smithellaceae bacterium]
MKWYHIGIKAKDSAKSIRFYQNVLGLRVVDTAEILGKTFTFVGNDTIQIEIEQANPGDTQADPSSMTGLNHFSVVVEDIQKLVKEARNKGADILMDPFQPRPDRFTTFIRDPDGVLIQIIQYADNANTR